MITIINKTKRMRVFLIPEDVLCKAKKTITAPMARKTAKSPMVAGRLRVISGMRLPRKPRGFESGLIPLVVNSLPHTRQRVASSLKRVPHVGQSFVCEVFSVVISKSYRCKARQICPK